MSWLPTEQIVKQDTDIITHDECVTGLTLTLKKKRKRCVSSVCLCVQAGVQTLVAVTEEAGEFSRVLQLQERSVCLQCYVIPNDNISLSVCESSKSQNLQTAPTVMEELV